MEISSRYRVLDTLKVVYRALSMERRLALLIIFVLSAALLTAQTTRFEAEDGTVFNGASVKDCASCSQGQYVGDMGGPGEGSNGYFTVETNVSEAGTYSLTFRFSSGDPRTIFISANGNTPVEAVCESADWGIFADRRVSIDLAQGSNTIRFFNDQDYAPDIDFFTIAPQESPILSFEAEDGELFGNADIQQCGACSGGEQVGNIGDGNGYFTTDVNVAEGGAYTMTLSFSSGDPRSIFISVNDGTAIETICDSGDWGVVGTTEIGLNLQSGVNSIRFFNDTGFGPNIDKFELELDATLSLSFEAEDGTIFGAADIQECGSCSGGAQVGNIGGGNGYFTSEVIVEEGGIYNMTLSFSSGDPRSIFISVNDGGALELICDSGDWGVVATAEVGLSLVEGTNIIRFFNDVGFGPNIDKFELELESIDTSCSNCEEISFSSDGEIHYNLDNGNTSVFIGGRQIVTGAYANLSDGNMTVTSRDYSNRVATRTTITDGFGTGEKTTITLSGAGLPNIQQVFYTYPDKAYFLTEVVIVGDNVQSNYIAPLISNNVNIHASGDNRVLTVPFDNDTFIRYTSNQVQNNANSTSSEVTAFYENNSRNGLVVGSIEQSTWKTGVRAMGSGSTLSELNVWSGYTSNELTRDVISHGTVSGKDVKSSKIFFGLFEDWRIGMEEFGKANVIAEPQYLFEWTGLAPLGWNSWGSIQDDLNLQNAKAVADFIANELPGFRREGTAFVNLDSYWDNMADGGLEGDFSQLTEFVEHCKALGLKPGIYWGPFIDFGKFNRRVEGSTFNYVNAWTKVNGGYHDLNEGRAMDPTHPATKERINLVIDKFKANGFEMIKIDFIGHAAVESDAFYDPNVTTGMQAFHHGMKYLTDRLDDQMLVYTAISPSMASAPYSHMRRIATDAYTDINETQYTLNSTTYGWWQSYLYDFIDADHVVFRDASIGENRARLVSSVVTGTMVVGDDYSTNGIWDETSENLLQRREILELAAGGQAFRPVEGNSQEGASEAFVKQSGNTYHVAIINYGDEKSYSIPLRRLGIPNGVQCVKELFHGKLFATQNESLQVVIGSRDAQIFEITVGNSTCAFSLPRDNFKVGSRNISCPGEENGKIMLEVDDHNYVYNVSISDLESFSLPDSDGSFQFESGDLPAGEYEVCFTVDGIGDYEQCHQITIREPGTLSVGSGRNSPNGRVDYDLTGLDRYLVSLNGEDTIIYFSGLHNFQLKKGLNKISIKGDLDCQGEFSEEIYVPGLVAFPNPFADRLSIFVSEENQKVQVAVYSANGALLSDNIHAVSNYRLNLDLSQLDSGTYILKVIGQEFQETIKITKE